MKKPVFIIIALLLAGLTITIYLMYTHEMPDRVAGAPDYTLTAGELLTAFQKDEPASTAKYFDKVIRLAGAIRQVDTAGSLTLVDQSTPGEIIVAVDPRYKKSLPGIPEGAAVTVQGVCSSYSPGDASGDDLLSDLGATIRFRSGGIRQ